MVSADNDAQTSSFPALAASWQATLVVGVLTLIIGLVVSFHPTGSLNVVAVLLGILMILSGIFHLIRMFDSEEIHRVWLGIAGLMFIVVGVVLIRHLDLSRAAIGLVIGITWIVQGLTALIGGIAGDVREGRAWWITFGVISVIAGLVVVSAPASSLNVLAVLLGIWFVIMGIFEIIGALMLRHASSRSHGDVTRLTAHPRRVMSVWLGATAPNRTTWSPSSRNKVRELGTCGSPRPGRTRRSRSMTGPRPTSAAPPTSTFERGSPGDAGARIEAVVPLPRMPSARLSNWPGRPAPNAVKGACWSEGPEQPERHLEESQTFTGHLSLLCAGAPWNTLGVHGGADRLQGREHVRHCAAGFLVLGRPHAARTASA